jgi:hypothetical protein
MPKKSPKLLDRGIPSAKAARTEYWGSEGMQLARQKQSRRRKRIEE